MPGQSTERSAGNSGLPIEKPGRPGLEHETERQPATGPGGQRLVSGGNGGSSGTQPGRSSEGPTLDDPDADETDTPSDQKAR